MKSTVENLGPTRVRLAVEVPASDLKASLDTAYKAIAQQVRVPGFRPGKVPARIIDQRVGRGVVLQEAVNDALPRLYSEAAREHELQPIGQPDIEISNFEQAVDGADLQFTAEVDVRPEITLPELEGIEVSVDDVEVTDADIDEQLDSLRDRFSSLTGVDRPIENGDYLSLDLTSVIDGEEVEDGSAKGRSYVVGSGDYIDGLDDAVLGKSAGDSVTFTAPLRHGEHEGEDAEVTVNVRSVKVKELPELDDDFAQLASEFDTIDELRADLRDRLGRVRVMEQGAEARNKLLEQIIDQVDFPLPESAVNEAVEQQQHEVVHALGHDETLIERFLQAQGKSREEWDAEVREGAEKSVRAQFVLDAVAQRSNVQVGDAELTQYLVSQASQYQMSPQDFANQIVQSGNLPLLVADIRRNKALAEVLQSAKITDASGNEIDLEAALGGAADGDDFADDFADDGDEAAAGSAGETVPGGASGSIFDSNPITP